MKANLSNRTLNELGEGVCSVPMWMGGCPAGFCGEPAYGERPPSREFWSYAQNTMVREDGRFDGYVPGLACRAHGGPRFRTFMDGDAWCAVMPDFINLQESPAGFGKDKESAISDLQTSTAARS